MGRTSFGQINSSHLKKNRINRKYYCSSLAGPFSSFPGRPPRQLLSLIDSRGTPLLPHRRASFHHLRPPLRAVHGPPSTVCSRTCIIPLGPHAPCSSRHPPPPSLPHARADPPLSPLFFFALVKESCRRRVDPLSLTLPLVRVRSSTPKNLDASSSSAALILPTTTTGAPLKPLGWVETTSTSPLHGEHLRNQVGWVETTSTCRGLNSNPGHF
jgi:hypothetical protein